MAHKKGVGSSDNGRDSKSKRLGVKIYGGQTAKAGNIIVRQRGTKFHAGENTYLGKDFTIHAKVEGKVFFKKRQSNRTYVNIIPDLQETAETISPMPIAKSEPLVEQETAKLEKVEATSETDLAEANSTAEIESTAMVAEETAEVVETVTEEVEATESIAEDDLTKIEGIGPKISGLLKEAGIKTFAQLAETEADKIREILADAGNRYKSHDPTTWSKQSSMAATGQWEELKAYQDTLDGGKEPAE